MPPVAALAFALGLGAGLDVEVAAGELPVSALEPSEPAATVTAVPRLRLGEPGRDPLVLSYHPRLFFRYPHSLELGRPTLLHQAQADWSQPVSRDFHVGAQLSGSYGEADFTATQAVFGEEQVVTPEESVLEVARVAGALVETWAVDRRTTLRLSLPSGYQVSGRASAGTQRTTWNTGANPGVTYALTRRDTAMFDVVAMVIDSGAPRFLQTSALAGWTHLLSARVTTELGAGVSRVDAVRGETRGTASYYALGYAGVDHRRQTGTEGVRLGLDSRLDPVLGEVRPQLSLDATVTQSASRTVTVSGGLGAGTTANREPLEGRNETRYGGNVMATWQVDPLVGLRAGFRAQWLAPHWMETLSSQQRTLLGFVGVSLFYPP